MKINSFKIMYSTTIPIQSYGINDKIAVEMEYVPSSQEQYCLEELVREQKTELDSIVAKLYPDLHRTEPERGVVITRNDIKFESPMPVGLTAEAIQSCDQLWQLEKIYFPLIDKLKDKEEQRKLWIVYDEVYAKLKQPQ